MKTKRSEPRRSTLIGIENCAAVVVQIKKRGIASVRGAERTKRPNFAFRQPGCLFDENIATGPRMDRLREGISVVGVGRHVDAKDAMSCQLPPSPRKKKERDDRSLLMVD